MYTTIKRIISGVLSCVLWYVASFHRLKMLLFASAAATKFRSQACESMSIEFLHRPCPALVHTTRCQPWWAIPKSSQKAEVSSLMWCTVAFLSLSALILLVPRKLKEKSFSEVCFVIDRALSWKHQATFYACRRQAYRSL